jgi:hypothetical protein
MATKAMSRTMRACSGIWILSGLLVLQSAGAQEKDAEVYFDFRGQPLPSNLVLVGAQAEQHVKMEPEGLRIVLPKGRAKAQGVGIGTTFGLRGDFEVTTTLEILHAEEPTVPCFGVGATLNVEKVDPPEGTNLGRIRRMDGQDLVMCDRRYIVPGGKPKFAGQRQACTDKLVQLRLQRTGSKLAYRWAAPPEGEFKQLHEDEFGTQDIKAVQIRVRSGETPDVPPYGVEVRLIDLRIRRSDAAVGNENQAKPSPPLIVADPQVPAERRSGSERASLLLVVLITLLLLAAGLWLRFRRPRSSAR